MKAEAEFDFMSLSVEDQKLYYEIAVHRFGNPHSVVGMTGEPLYFHKDFSLNPISVFVLEQIRILKNKN